MKVLHTFLFLWLICHNVYSQQFVFKMFFTDAEGNKDTITLGYDSLATDGIDNVFGEKNIVATPWRSDFDVRISNSKWNQSDTFYTKKQIVKSKCFFTDVQNIDIVSKHWPVSVTWDSTLFDHPCRKGSVFTSVIPGGWWDIGSTSNLYRQELALHSKATFTPNYHSWGYTGYISDNGDTVSTFFQTFSDTALLTVSVRTVHLQPDVLVYPNPAQQSIHIEVAQNQGKVSLVQIVSVYGNIVATSTLPDVAIQHLSKGLYFATVTTRQGYSKTVKFYKE